jgi:hypothetical protein
MARLKCSGKDRPHKLQSKPHLLSVCMLALLLVIAPGVMTQESDYCTTLDEYSIPDIMSAFGTYPNPLELTEQDRDYFHPVVVFPANEDIPVMDLRHTSDGIAPEEDRIKSRKEKSLWKLLQRAILNISRRLRKKPLLQPRGKWAVGKYDENRVGLYSTEIFEDTENSIDGFSGKRTLHLGVDLMTPAGTKVYAFCDGVVHSAGYNSELGDYGNVVVIQHNVPGGAKPRTVWALYGHMDAGTIRGKRPGTRILKGQVIGRVGGIHENGGWVAPHLHFQLSSDSPATHDMPGAASIDDRPRALIHYPDPRYVLGPVH